MLVAIIVRDSKSPGGDERAPLSFPPLPPVGFESFFVLSPGYPFFQVPSLHYLMTVSCAGTIFRAGGIPLSITHKSRGMAATVKSGGAKEGYHSNRAVDNIPALTQGDGWQLGEGPRTARLPAVPPRIAAQCHAPSVFARDSRNELPGPARRGLLPPLFPSTGLALSAWRNVKPLKSLPATGQPAQRDNGTRLPGTGSNPVALAPFESAPVTDAIPCHGKQINSLDPRAQSRCTRGSGASPRCRAATRYPRGELLLFQPGGLLL